MTGNITLQSNFYPLFAGINHVISRLMSSSGTKSYFGLLKKHVGISMLQRGWTEFSWEGYKSSDSLTNSFAERRSMDD